MTYLSDLASRPTSPNALGLKDGCGARAPPVLACLHAFQGPVRFPRIAHAPLQDTMHGW